MSDPAGTLGAVFEGRYEILHALRGGGFADVYQARQLATGQAVAVKIMRRVGDGSPADTARRSSRFRREIRLCGQLHHPNIVGLIDSGQTDEGQLYIVFEFVPGQNLADVLADEGALDPREARHLMLQVLDALGCAHGQGVVHRDLKPANIMIVPTGARRNALVLDFGIGALTEAATIGGDARLTGSNEVVCTPSYAAPEQLRGMAPTARSDLYAWGLVFLECLTGRSAISGRSLQEVLSEQMRSDPIALPTLLVGHPLGAILRQATIKDVVGRVATATSLLRELEACNVEGLRREDLTEIGASSPRPPDPSPWAIRLAEPMQSDPLSDAGAPSATPADLNNILSARPLEGERRPLTVVCCALTATGLGLETVDVEEVDEVVGDQQEVCAEIARRHHGYVAGALGERVLLYFGYPAAQEDDARRAARAALEIVTEARARSAHLTAARGVTVEARIGIHTGLVIAREGQSTSPPVGTTTQIAAQLSAFAASGSILASGETYRLLRGSFAFAAEGAHQLAGVARPIDVYRLQKESAGLGSPRDGAELDTTRLIGRGRELELLVQRWSQTQQGIGQSVLLIGGPGIGKSRLAYELVRRLRGEAHTCLECRCAEEIRHSALRPVIEMFERLMDARSDAEASRLERIEALLVHLGCDLAETVPLMAALLSIPLDQRYTAPEGSPQRQKQRRLNLLLSLLCEMAEEQPVLLVVEDLHWADPMTLEWLGTLVEEVSSARIMALLTARPELALPWPTSGMLQIQLDRLDRTHIQQMVAELTGGLALPGLVLEQIVDRADGVPLFIEELTRMVLESTSPVELNECSAPAGRISELAIPTTLRGLLMARLDRLGRAKETAQLAATLGREFSYDVLAAVSSRDEAALREDLDKLLAADLINHRRRVKAPTYVFKHGLIRDAAYELLPRRARLRVHASIARTLEERFPEVVQARPGLLAHHHAAAEQKRQAIVYAERAAELALQRAASNADDTEAVEHLTHALGWLAVLTDDRERAVTELRLNSLLIFAIMDHRGYMDRELAAAVKRSQELSDALGDSPLTAPTLFAMFEYHHMRSHRCEARTLAERLVRMADELHDDDQAVWALPLLGQCLWCEGKLVEARQHLERALLLYDPVLHRRQAFVYGMDSRAYAQSTLSLVLYIMGYPERALAEGQAAVEWARELDHPNSLGVALLFLAGLHYYSGEREKAAQVSIALTALTDRYRLWLKDYGWIMRRWAESDAEQLAPLLTSLRDSDQQLGMTHLLSLEAQLLAEHGYHDAAIERLDDCVRLALETGETYYVSELYRFKAISLQACDVRAVPESEECLRQGIAFARGQGALTLELRSTVSLCRSLLQQGRREEALALLQQSGDWPAEHAALPELGEALALLRELSV